MIPIKNIYYMVLYAFEHIKNKSEIKDKDLENLKTVNDVVATIFLSEVTKIVKKGIIKKYNSIEEETNMIKGRINVKESMKLFNAKLNCTFDEFNANNKLNAVLKYTLNILIFLDNKYISNKARKLFHSFDDVEYKQFNLSDIYKIEFDRLSRDYEYAVKLAAFIISGSIPTDKVNKVKFIDILKNDEVMSNIFEKFLLNFYKIHTSYKVSGSKQIEWYLKPIDESDHSLIPKMKTDIELENSDVKIIMDAKYYRNAFTNQYECKKVSSSNMYQINTYLMHNRHVKKNLRGILIYPANGYSFKEKFQAEFGFTIEFATVDLNKDWKDIESELIKIIE